MAIFYIDLVVYQIDRIRRWEVEKVEQAKAAANTGASKPRQINACTSSIVFLAEDLGKYLIYELNRINLFVQTLFYPSMQCASSLGPLFAYWILLPSKANPSMP